MKTDACDWDDLLMRLEQLSHPENVQDKNDDESEIVARCLIAHAATTIARRLKAACEESDESS